MEAEYTEGMDNLILSELVQSTRMSLAFARNFAAYRLWMLRERPENLASKVEADDICIHYHCYSRGEPIVLLHGGFMFSETWAGQIPALAHGHRVIAMDSRGHGRTTLGTQPLTFRRMAEDTAALIDKLRLGRVHLVGWSDGGCTALALAMDRPELVRSMTLLGTPFSTENYSEEAKHKIASMLLPHSLSMLGMTAIRRLLKLQ